MISKRFIIIFFICLFLPVSILAKSGVESIIEKDMQENGAFQAEYDPKEPATWLGDYSYDPNTTAGNVEISLSFANMKEAVNDSLGIPEANYLILILFSLAALLQMGRVIAGSGDWVAFTVRVIVILAFLRAYSILFDGVEVFFAYLTDQVMGDQTAYQAFWSKFKLMDAAMGSNYQSMSSVFTTNFLKDGLFFSLSCLSSIIAYALYTLIFVVQSCIVITLRYLGPIIISLAIIPETDFTSGFISTTFQTFSWSVISAILIKIMNTMTTIQVTTPLNMQDMVSISAMNFCYGLAFLFIPIMTGMLYSGKGLGGLGAAMTMLGGGFMQRIGGYFKSKTYDKAFDKVERGAGIAAKGAWAVSGGMAYSLARRGVRAGFDKGYGIAASAADAIKPHVRYAMDHVGRITPAGRARFIHKHYPNAGYGNMPQNMPKHLFQARNDNGS